MFNIGIRTPSRSVLGTDLPLARTVSFTLFPNADVDDVTYTLLAMQYGQIITHDMGMIDGTTQSSTFCIYYCYVPKLLVIRHLIRWVTGALVIYLSRIIAASHSTRCCTVNGQIAPDLAMLPLCNPILIPKNDPVYGGSSIQCLNFVRSTTDLDRGCSSSSKHPNTAQQVSHLHLVYDLFFINCHYVMRG